MGLIGKILLYVGFMVLVLGCCPTLIVSLIPSIDASNAVAVGVAALAYHSFWPGIVFASGGALFCIWKYLWDRLPY